jgi:hypothetical protein
VSTNEDKAAERRRYCMGVVDDLRWLIDNHMKGSRKHEARVLCDNLTAALGVVEWHETKTQRELAARIPLGDRVVEP